MEVRKKIRCPFCGHEQNIQYVPGAVSRGLFMRCKARQCRKEFEVRLAPDGRKKTGSAVVPMSQKEAGGQWLKTGRAQDP